MYTLISNIDIRNRVRGLTKMSTQKYPSGHSPISQSEQLSKILGDSKKQSDISAIVQIIFDENFGIKELQKNNFPTSPSHILGRTFLPSDNFNSNIRFSVERVLFFHQPLEDFFKKMKEFSINYSNKDSYEKSIEVIQDLIKDFGHSLEITGKICSLIKESQKYDILADVYNNLLEKEKQIAFQITYGYLDFLYSSDDISKGRIAFAELENIKRIRNMIYFHCSKKVAYNAEDLSKLFFRRGCQNIVDLSIIIFQNIELIKLECPDLVEKIDKICDIVRSPNKNYLDRSNFSVISEESNFDLFSESTAYLSDPTVSSWRHRIENILDSQDCPELISEENKLRYSCLKISSVIDLYNNADDLPHSKKSFTEFERTLALIYLLSTDDESTIGINFQYFLKLMCRTTFVGTLISEKNFKKLIDISISNTACEASRFSLNLIHDILQLERDFGNQRKYFRTAKIFERGLREHFQSDIEKFFDQFVEYKQVHNYLRSYMDEQFLERVWTLCESYEDVLKNRIFILKHEAISFDDKDAENEAEIITRELRLRALRGVVNQTRISIDERLFSEWMKDFHIPQFERLKDFFQSHIVETLDIENEESVDIAIFRLKHLFIEFADEILQGFCEDERFGIAHYISTRIRHGSMRGELSKRLRELFDEYAQLREAGLYNMKDFANDRKEFFVEHRNLIEDWRKERVQILSADLPLGLIDPNVRDPMRETLALDMFKRVFNARSVSDDAFYSFAMEFCWQALETDFLRLKEALSREFFQDAKKPIQKMNFGFYNTDRLAAFRQELQSIIHENVIEFSNWFSRPERASSGASMSDIIELVLDECTKMYTEFQPKVNKDIEAIVFYGSAFQWLYDIGLILFENVARHGEIDGQIDIKSSITGRARSQIWTYLEVVSDIKNGSDEGEIEKKIRELLNNGTSDGLTTEGLSGLRKVRHILSTQTLDYKFLIEISDSKFCVKIDFSVLDIYEDDLREDSYH